MASPGHAGEHKGENFQREASPEAKGTRTVRKAFQQKGERASVANFLGEKKRGPWGARLAITLAGLADELLDSLVVVTSARISAGSAVRLRRKTF
jgi:hypothetical protein